MHYILFGEDSFSIRQALEEIKTGLGDQALLAVNTTTIEGEQLTPSHLRAAGEAVPFLAERRLVIVSHLLESFESKGKSSREKKGTPAKNRQDNLNELASCICQMPDSTVLILVDNRISSSNPLLKEISAGAVIRSFPLLKNRKLRQWIQQRVSERGGSATPQALDLLAKLVGGNLWSMATEIDKLLLFTAGRRIEDEDVRQISSQVQETNVFAMVDAILEFKPSVAQKLLQQLLQKGAAPVYLMAMLSRQIQLIVRTKELKSRKRPQTEIQSRLGLTSEFVLNKTLEQAARYSPERLKNIYRKLLETDLTIKTGKSDGELALTVLIAELCQQH